MRKALLDSPVATTALIVSAAALIVSVRSCAIGEEAQVQARAQYQQERQLVLTGNFKTPKETDCTQEMTIAPISPDFKFQTGTAFFPPKVFDQPVPIGNDGRFGLMGALCSRFQEFVKTKLKPEKGIVKVGQGVIPLIIKSFYAVKGEAYTDISLYFIDTTIVMQEVEWKPVSVSFSGLSFAERLSPFAPIDTKRLDDFVDSPDGAYIPPRAP